jgi:hypothetical protein
VLTQVADHPDDFLGDEPADGAAGVNAHHEVPGQVKDEPGGLQEERVFVDESPGRLGDLAGVGAVPDRECQSVLGDQVQVVASSSTDSATILAPTSARLPAARWNARSWALQYGHHDPR